MTRLLLASAACLCVAALPSPASAQQGSFGVQVHSGSGGGPFAGASRHRDGDHRRRGDTVVLGGYGPSYSPYWGYTNNRSFAPDSFNDWWHDRPDRSLPRWVGQNANCERQYSTGAGWRC